MTGPSIADVSSVSLNLLPDPTAPGRARRFVAETLHARGRTTGTEAAELLVSELVTNAVVHAASAVVVEVTTDDQGVLVRVRDADTGPLVGRAGGGTGFDEGGRGFILVDRLADMWGTEHHGGHKTVWFRLHGDAQPLPAAGAASIAEAAPTDGPALAASRRRLHRLLLPPSIRSALTLDEQVAEV